MTAKELSEKMVEEKNTLKLYGQYVRKLFTVFNWGNDDQWLEYLDITHTILDIFHSMDDLSLDSVFENLCEAAAFQEENRPLMEQILEKADAYEQQYESEAGICNVCGNEVYYLPLPAYYEQQRVKYGGRKTVPETLNRQKYICPECGAVDRDRMIIAYIERAGLLQKGTRVLQIAPAQMIDRYIQQHLSEGTYDTADLFMEDVTYRTDIQNMVEIAEDTYDVWICSHVLEHVADDRKALRELRRILKPDGCGILLVPLDLSRKITDEEPGCSEAENWRRFGQGDHVRAYAKKDFLERIEASGFELECIGKEYFGEQFFKNCGLLDTSTLYIVRKKERSAEPEDAMLITSHDRNVTDEKLCFARTLKVDEIDKYLRDYDSVIEFIQEGINEGIRNIVLALGNKVYNNILQVLYKGGLYGLVRVWILPEYYSDKADADVERDFLLIEDYNKPRLESFQVHLTDLCNLNCKGCGHFSNIAKQANFIDLKKYRMDLERMKELFWGVERIYLLGGEPLLYPDVEEAMVITREIFPDAQIRITTNGLLLPTMPDSFFDMVKATKSHIEISMYPETHKRWEQIFEVLQKHGLIKTTIIWERVEFTKKLLKEKSGNPAEAFENCHSRKNACYLLREGKLAKCPMMLLIDIFDQEYNVKRECKRDYIDLHHDNVDGWQALEQLNTVSEMCNYCAKNSQVFEWNVRAHADASEEDWYIKKES